MHQYFAVAAAAATLAFSAAPAQAALINFGGTFNVTSNHGTGLIVDTSPSNGAFSFNLNDTLGSSTTIVPLFRISTPEADVGGDDLIMSPITVTFNFLTPAAGTVPVEGDTYGESTWFGFINWQSGVVQWDNPAPVFTFGNTGKVSIDLSDTKFDTGLYGLTGKSAKVNAKFTLTELPSAVPEPATWAMMITGFGLAGTAIRRRRSIAIAA